MSPRTSAPINLEHVLLALLDQKPMHGYDLFQELCATPGVALIWNIKQGLLYALLDKLENHHFLSSHLIQNDARPTRKVFSVTAAGRQSLKTWISSPVRRPRDLRQEFLAKLIITRRYGSESALELIHAQQQACLAWLNDLHTDSRTLVRDHLDEWLVFSYRINRLEAILDWLKTCELELSREYSGS